eukprot:jgi/Chrzof1/14692/Cz09g12080.t1
MSAVPNGNIQDIQAAAQQAFRDCTRYVVFDNTGAVLASNFAVDPSELQPLAGVFADRDNAITAGMIIQGTRYEVCFAQHCLTLPRLDKGVFNISKSSSLLPEVREVYGCIAPVPVVEVAVAQQLPQVLDTCA